MTLWDSVASAISQATQHPFQLHTATPAGGGDINECFRLDGNDGARYFLKLNDASLRTLFTAEASGLAALAASTTIRVPHAVVHGHAGQRSFLVLEYLPLGGRGNPQQLGEQLAALHRNTAARFGFVQDNFIGTTHQPNGWKHDWIAFWREQRLGHQLQLARHNQLGDPLQALGNRLMDALPGFFDGYTPQPSLLHGDLWSGNHGFLLDGTPVIFDPAAYYGDRECDLAMTELFGGYAPAFYAAYRNAWPLDAGYTVRRDLYNLYHILNHANLFGGGYVRQAETLMRKLLSSIN